MAKKKSKRKSTAEAAGAPGELRDHYHYSRKVQEEMEELQNLSSKLLDVGVAISSEINLYALLTRIIDEAKGLLKAQNGTLYLVDPDKRELYFHVVDVEQLKEVRIPIDNKSIAGYVALTGENLNHEDVYKIPKTKPYKFNKSIDLKTGLRTISMLTVPMQNHEGVITGAVQLINKMDGGEVAPFSQRDAHILKSLASQAAVAIENAQLYKEIADLFASLVRFSASAIDERDPATAGHSRRVAMYALETARAMKCFSQDELMELEYAAWLHDVGKIGVREHILNKENKLYPDELEKIRERFETAKLSFKVEFAGSGVAKKKRAAGNDTGTPVTGLESGLKALEDDFLFVKHSNRPGFMTGEDCRRVDAIAAKTFADAAGVRRPLLTASEAAALKIVRGNLTDKERDIMNAHVNSTFKVLSRIPFSKRLRNVPAIAANHHERLDGSGYPNGLKGDSVLLQSRILAIVDVYDALTAQDRPYKPAMPVERALKILQEEVGAGKLDGKILQVFVDNKIYALKDPGSESV